MFSRVTLLLIFVPMIAIAQPCPSTQWTRTLDVQNSDENLLKVIQTVDGGFVIIGGVGEMGPSDGYLWRLDEHGLLVGGNRLAFSNIYRDIAGIPGGVVALVDSWHLSPRVGHLRKLSYTGQIQWEVIYDTTGIPDLNSIAFGADGCVLTCGITVSQSHDTNGYVAKYSLAGDSIWARSYGSASTEFFTTICVTPDSGCIVSGMSRTSGTGFHLLKLNIQGDTVWARHYSRNLQAYYYISMHPMPDGGCILESNATNGLTILRVDMHGDSVWGRTYAGDLGRGITPLADGKFAILSNSGVVNIDSAGNIINTCQIAGEGGVGWLYPTPDSSYVYTRAVGSTWDGHFPPHRVTDGYAMVIKADPHHLVSVEPTHVRIPEQYALSTFPNPFNPTATISVSLPKAGNVKLAVFDINGRLIKILSDEVVSAGGHQVTFDGSSLPSGIYFVRLQSGESALTQKMVLLK